MCVTSSQHSNVQVTITVTCLNFAVTGSRILLHPLSSSCRGKPSRKITLNSNGKVNCRELARRPCLNPTFEPAKSGKQNGEGFNLIMVGLGENFHFLGEE